MPPSAQSAEAFGSYRGFSEMVRDHGNPRIAVVLFQDGYRFIYILYCMLCQDGDCDVTVRTSIHSK